MKIIHVTDSHGTMKTPENRIDSYYYSFLKKLAELYYISMKDKVDFIIHTGDLFHSSRVSNKFMGQVAEVIKKIPVPFYVVPGNHDIDGYSMATIDQTSLGLLAKTQVIRLLDREHPLLVTTKEGITVAISGQEYYQNIDSGDMNDFAMQQSPMDINILCYHGYIADTPQHPNIKCTYPKDVTTDADIILCGHYHRSFEIDMGDIVYYNPGSMMRVEMTDWNKTHMPQYGIIDIYMDEEDGAVYDYTFQKFISAAPADHVFNLASKAVIKTHGITLENFKNSIASTMQAVQPTASLGSGSRAVLDDVMSKYLNQEIMNVQSTVEPSLVVSIKDDVTDIYDSALQECTDSDLSVTKGFVAASAPIKISRVEIKNFQSHEHTLIDFKNGLNIIVGESSKGKTAIFRAMLWCIDNSPSGNAFIRTGSKSCSVKITFSNGAYIERGRTEKSSGYYKIWDGNPQNPEQEFKGFSNNIPIEILNVHQMPKVAVTKNFETHLNVMTQLEKPFLITESVNEKAAAIGRITGTDVFDKAIKYVTQEITVQERLLKEKSVEVQELDKKIAAYDEQDLKASIVLMQSYTDDINSISNTLSAYETLKAAYSHYDQEKAHIQTDIIPAYTAVADTEVNTQQARTIYNTLLAMVGMAERLETLEAQKKQLSVEVDKAQQIVVLEDDVKKAQKNIEDTKAMLNIMLKSNELSSELTFHKGEEAGCNEILSLSDSVSSCIASITNTSSMLALKEQYLHENELHDYHKGKIDNINKDISELQDDADKVKQDRNNFILSVGICPCCGQNVTDKHIKQIVHSMEV